MKHDKAKWFQSKSVWRVILGGFPMDSPNKLALRLPVDVGWCHQNFSQNLFEHVSQGLWLARIKVIKNCERLHRETLLLLDQPNQSKSAVYSKTITLTCLLQHHTNSSFPSSLVQDPPTKRPAPWAPRPSRSRSWSLEWSGDVKPCFASSTTGNGNGQPAGNMLGVEKCQATCWELRSARQHVGSWEVPTIQAIR